MNMSETSVELLQSKHRRDDVYVIGVDVGTGSARAGLFDFEGRMLSVAKRDITLYREAGSIVEQSSSEIWSAVCAIIRCSSVKSSGVKTSSK